MSESPKDTKREDFRKYLDAEGIIEFLTKHLVKLYEQTEKPSNALEYLVNNFTENDNKAERKAEQLRALEKENSQLKEVINNLQSEKADLESQVKQLQSISKIDASHSKITNAQSQEPTDSEESKNKAKENIDSNGEEPMEISEDNSNIQPCAEHTNVTEEKEDQDSSEKLHEISEEKADEVTPQAVKPELQSPEKADVISQEEAEAAEDTSQAVNPELPSPENAEVISQEQAEAAEVTSQATKLELPSSETAEVISQEEAKPEGATHDNMELEAEGKVAISEEKSDEGENDNNVPK